MTKRLAIFFALILFSANTILACCAAQWVNVFPGNKNISANTIFLIDFHERDFKFKNKIKSFSFFALTGNGEKLSLSVLQANFSGDNGQILLKPSQALCQGDSISISIVFPIGIDSNNLRSSFQWQVENKKWFVAYKADNEPPIWDTDSLKFKLNEDKFSSIGGFAFVFNCPVTDNFLNLLTYEFYRYKNTPMLYEITFNNEKHICASNDLNASIYTSDCGSNFMVSKEGMHSAKIRPMDSSGNFGESQTVIFGI